MSERFQIHRNYARGRRIVLHHGDCHKFVNRLPDRTIKLTVTSPPYCMGKEYERGKRLNEFVENHRILLPELERVTQEGGSVCFQIGYHVNQKVVTPLDFVIHQLVQELTNLTLRDRIVWTFGHGLHSKTKFSGRHEMILWYSKGDTYDFNLDAIRVPQKYPGKKAYKGPLAGEYSSNPLGKNPSNVWDLPNVKGGHVEKTDHPCQFPVAIPERLISALTSTDDLVFDPFCGSGTVGVASILKRRVFIGCETELRYIAIAEKRFREAKSGNLKFRPTNQKIYTPEKTSPLVVNPFPKS